MFGGATKPLFGAPQTQSGFSFGTATNPASNIFGAKPATTSAFNLLTTPAKTTASLFGGLNTTTSTTAPFSFSAAVKPASLFGNTFSATATTKSGSLLPFQPAQSSGFQLGTVQQNTGLQQQQQQLARQSVDAFYASLSQPLLFGDERDNVIARLNQLQAMLGMGMGFSALGSVNYSPDNPFSRFRGIAYNVLPTSSESDGLVCMELNKSFTEVLPQKQAIQDHIFRFLGGRPNYQLLIEEIRPCARSQNSTEIVVKVIERQASGATHIIPASDLANFFCSAAVRPQLESQLCVCRLMPELAPSASQINAYLEIPPAGFDKRVWRQACEENPAPNRLIPVPVIGFTDLKRRRDEQLLFGEQQRNSVKHLLSVAVGLQAQQLSSTQKLTQIKRKQVELNHRVLKLLSKQTVTRRAGFAISAEEEALRCSLEHIWSEIAGPRGLRARIQQLLPSVRSTKASGSEAAKKQQQSMDGFDEADSVVGSAACWWQHPDVVDDLREYLTQRTAGIKEMRRLLTELNAVVRILTEKKSKVSKAVGVATGLIPRLKDSWIKESTQTADPVGQVRKVHLSSLSLGNQSEEDNGAKAHACWEDRHSDWWRAMISQRAPPNRAGRASGPGDGSINLFLPSVQKSNAEILDIKTIGCRCPRCLRNEHPSGSCYGRVNRAINEIILPRGEIPFVQIDPDAEGSYLCCYNTGRKVECADEIQLSVKRPRPEIFHDTFLNITPVVFPYSVYWLPQMLTTSLQAELIFLSEGVVEFHCFYYVKSKSSRRVPNVNWYFNDRQFVDPRLTKLIDEFDQVHKVTTNKIACEEEYMRGERSQCFKSTLRIYPLKNGKRRSTMYTCEVRMSNILEENKISVNYWLGTARQSKSKLFYDLADMKEFGNGCNGKLEGSQSLEVMIEELNECERNAFVRFWVSPASDSDGVVQARCSKPFYVSFREVLKLIELPADVKVVRMLADEAAGYDSLNGSSSSSVLEKRGEQILKSNFSTFEREGKEYAVFESSLQGNVSLGCQSRQVLVACTYGPLFQLKLVDTPCGIEITQDDSTKLVPIIIGVTVGIMSGLLLTGFCLCRRRRRGSRQRAVWKTVDEYTSSLLVHRRLGNPPLPVPLASVKKMREYLEVEENQWPLSTCRLRLDEQIACGSYGDVFKGTLSTIIGGSSLKRREKLQKQIVAKVLNDTFSKEHLLEFANEVAILRLIGAHPGIVQFMGCARRTSLGNQPVLIIEYASQGSLLRYLRSLQPNRETSLAEVVMTYWWTRARTLINDFLNFALDIAGALIYLQEIAVVHCDIAARNVLLTESLKAKLSDFGMARVISQEEFTELQSSRKIPVRWSAPEVIKWNHLHARSDVWSFGVLLWEIFSLGETPYSHLESEDMVGEYVCDEGGRLSRPPLLSHDGIYELMTKCWSVSVESRPDVQSLLEGLQSASGGGKDGRKSETDEKVEDVSEHTYLPMETQEVVVHL
ncbi:hypothetical protein Aperf_G00000039634 [Anoplocephala perfoliata]